MEKCVSKTDTNPPFAFQIAFPRGTDFAGFLQGGSKSRDLQSEISVRIECRIESADSRLLSTALGDAKENRNGRRLSPYRRKPQNWYYVTHFLAHSVEPRGRLVHTDATVG